MLIQKQIEIEKLMDYLKEEQEMIGKRKELLIREEEELKFQSEMAQKIKAECEANLELATPELYQAIAALQTLSKKEIDEIRSFK
mmetsp:Transcript_21854/g.21028  ORF Transcript_21854/g.21028 Transcript_21854/m.21028 type:complete len:85 (+) Transcript_21854:3009-3263(+)